MSGLPARSDGERLTGGDGRFDEAVYEWWHGRLPPLLYVWPPIFMAVPTLTIGLGGHYLLPRPTPPYAEGAFWVVAYANAGVSVAAAAYSGVLVPGTLMRRVRRAFYRASAGLVAHVTVIFGGLDASAVSRSDPVGMADGAGDLPALT
jgi:hypothetical protein